jgi:hypothetical protein
MRRELQKRIINVSASLVAMKPATKLAHDEPEVDAIMNKVDSLLTESLDKIEQLKALQQASKYTEAAGASDLAAKAARDMSVLLSKASILLNQRATT